MENLRNAYLYLICALSVVVMGGCAHGIRETRTDLPPKNDVSASGRIVVGNEHAQVAIEFSNEDRRYIHDYYYRESREMKSMKTPPGLAKRDELPPGLQKQIQRNGKLPAGLEGRGLPAELERRLSPLPANYVRLQIGTDIVLMDQRTRVTVDVIKNILP